MPKRRRNDGPLRNSPFHPTVTKRAGSQCIFGRPWAKQGGDPAPKPLMEAAPSDFELGFNCAAQVFRQGLVGRRRRRRQKIDGVLDTLKLHASFDYTELSMKWKRGVHPPRDGSLTSALCHICALLYGQCDRGSLDVSPGRGGHGHVRDCCCGTCWCRRVCGIAAGATREALNDQENQAEGQPAVVKPRLTESRR